MAADSLTKKLVNDADHIVDEMLDGIIAAHPQHVRRLEHSPRSIVAVNGPRPGKVGIVIGGGSGHEPAFAGYVGKGLADAAAVGNVFASPSPDPIVEATKAIDGGDGVVYLYGNYAGDVMNFDMAAELAGMENITVRSIRVTDDVASAPPAERHKRRGIAGDLFVFKIAGAAADQGYDLDGVVTVAERANARTLSMGVALEPCSLPHTRRPHFDIGADEMEIGMGVHGEPGVARGPLKSADVVADELLNRILAELDLGPDTPVQVLVNGLGATSLMELYVLHRRVKQRLDQQRIPVERSLVGEYVTSLEMAGASLSIIAVDEELSALLDHPADCAMFRHRA